MTEASVWTPALITALVTALFAGMAIIITALTTLIVAVYGAKKSAEAAAIQNQAQQAKIHDAFNGTNTALQATIDRLQSYIASLPDATKEDIDRAAEAKKSLAEKDKLTEANVKEGNKPRCLF